MIAFSDLEVLRTRAREKKERSVAGPVQSTRRRISRSITSRAFNSAAAVAPAATDAEDVSEFGLAVIRAHNHSAAVAEAVENERHRSRDTPTIQVSGQGEPRGRREHTSEGRLSTTRDTSKTSHLFNTKLCSSCGRWLVTVLSSKPAALEKHTRPPCSLWS